MSTPFEDITVTLSDSPAARIDKALADAAPEEVHLSRSRITALIKEGRVLRATGAPVASPKESATPGEAITLRLPPPEPSEIASEAIDLEILHEDEALLVVNKPAGMVVHPAPGARSGTLVNALLHHCGDTLSGIGGVARPGIVHRIDKDTSGLLVVAKTDGAHHGLAAQFAEHSIQRLYLAAVHGRPNPGSARLVGLPEVSVAASGEITINAAIGRHPTDRKRMAVRRTGGKHAITHVRTTPGPDAEASRVVCQLETGRTHQIRVHLTHVGHPLIGDPVYGQARSAKSPDPAVAGFPRQALHAAVLGFTHPSTAQKLRFEAALPDDMLQLFTDLGLPTEL